MTMRNARRTGIVGLAVAALLLPGMTYAQATDWESMATGTIGSADLVLDGEQVSIDPIAECDTDGTAQSSSPGAEVEDFVEFDGGTTSCDVDQNNGVATSTVTGERFRLDGLEQYGGPRSIRVNSFSAKCTTTETGSKAEFELKGVTGMTLPSTIQPNTVVTIPGPAGAPPVATVTLNEKVIPDPPDGSMTVNLMHFRLFPQGPADEVGGDIVVGSVSCAPF